MWNVYRHRKGFLYLSLCSALHSENQSSFEVYRCLYENEKSKYWLRPSEMFFDQDDVGPRFELLGTIEVASPEDMKEILLFGFDAWGDGQSQKDFFAAYDKSLNHIRGKRYVLRLPDNSLVAGLNTLRFTRRLSGLASVATSPKYRNRGFATILLKAVFAILNDFEGVERLLLFSETKPDFYENFGFQILPEEYQHFSPSVAMLRANSPLHEDEARYLVDYF